MNFASFIDLLTSVSLNWIETEISVTSNEERNIESYKEDRKIPYPDGKDCIKLHAKTLVKNPKVWLLK